MSRSIFADYLDKQPKSKVSKLKSRLELKVAEEKARASKRATKQENINEIRNLVKEYIALKFKGRSPIKLTAKEKQRFKALGLALKKSGVDVAKAGAKMGVEGAKFLFLSPSAQKKLAAEARKKQRSARPSDNRRVKPSAKRKSKSRSAKKKRSRKR